MRCTLFYRLTPSIVCGYSAGSWSTDSYYHADGMGNITRLVNSTNGVVASYKYDAYGRTISSSGSLASANVYRFSSKLALDIPSLGLYYYGYRFYEPSLQRWLNRAPVQENGGILNLYGAVEHVFAKRLSLLQINLHTFNKNSPAQFYDAFGLMSEDVRPGDVGCAYSVGNKWRKDYKKYLASGSSRPEGDKWFHCMASCDMARKCSATASHIIGVLQEYGWYGPGPNTTDSRQDLSANRAGISGCKNTTRSCAGVCRDAGYSK